MSRHFAVFGHPVAHSLSPRIHARFAHQAGIDMDYVAIDAPPDAFVQALADFASRGGAGLPHLPSALVGYRTAAVDLSYGEVAIPFLAWARASGCRKIIDGLGMLVEQAALSFARWHGRAPDTEAIYAELRAEDASLVTAD